MFDKILIANRGEIACRIIETARKNAVRTVAVYSDADEKARHVRLADEAVHIGAPEAANSYLKGDLLIEVAKRTGAQAIHPGYGFLSENAEFAEACAAAGIVFIGPSADSIRAMGLKDRAKELMQAAGVPVVPGYQGEEQGPEFLKQQADEIGYPVLIKAVAGGGGKGMRLVKASEEFLSSLESCQREAKASFGNDHVLIEKYLTKPRHIEVQVFADGHGNAVHLFERDCSLQRRHQKVVEEAPAPDMPADVRKAMGDAAVTAAKAIGYCGAGTIEFIVDSGRGLTKDSFYFMEMNTRLQVEHPVTELVTGQDLVEWQLRVASGDPLPLSQDQIALAGHAFEVRLYAEDPANGFLPQTGKLSHLRTPVQDAHFRLDTGIEEGDEVSIYYDPMIAKLIVWDRTRTGALRQMARALRKTSVAGVRTNLDFLAAIFDHPDFKAGDVDTHFIEHHSEALLPTGKKAGIGTLACAAVRILDRQTTGDDPFAWSDGWRMNLSLKSPLVFIEGEHRHEIMVEYLQNGYRVSLEDESAVVSHIHDEEGRVFLMKDGDEEVHATVAEDGSDLTIFCDGRVHYLHHFVPGAEDAEEAGGSGVIVTPMPGKVSRLMVAEGDEVEAGQPLLVLEAMKMEHTLKAPVTGTVEKLSAGEGDQVSDGQVLVRITEPEQ
ncbi:acetyl/propionyl/methylcrotonyl-CoA carboxylase subunit alpha [Emcibacter sp.]|uniref:acetyl/propionyl/methylcrotonyl-CoA carboxylase subunit alpha n=1 Tax=Emcibacter sp. TaxID=1979954 RepID=UPI002AA76D9F|nr:acetyl/propionyl/methylcrotonyl-CoA carboxylase subunit alpha [Emcibacter sp.]